MSLNVKAAMLICTGFFSGLCWLVSRVALPVAPTLAERPSAGTPAPTVSRASTETRPLASSDEAPPFAHRSAFEAEAAAHRQSSERLSVAAVPPGGDGLGGRALPPLVGQSPGAETLAAERTESFEAESESREATLAARGSAGAGTDPGSDGAAAEPVLAGTGGGDNSSDSSAGRAAGRYTIRRGDSLAKIARQEWKTGDARLVQLLVEANPKLRARPNRLLIGEEIVIPEATAVDRVRRGEKPASVVASAEPSGRSPAGGARLAQGPPSARQPKTAPPERPAGKRTAGVAPAPSRETERSVPDKAGRKRPVPAPPRSGAPKVAALGGSGKVATAGGGSKPARETAPPRWYTIRQRDSLASIAERHLNDRQRWREIAELNDLDKPDKIVAGRRIKLPATLVARG